MSTESVGSQTYDVAIAGAGLAGSAAAILFRRQGLRVVLVDPYPVFPRMFRAEKIEPDQSALLRKFDLLDVVNQRTRMIREIVRAQNGRVRYRRKVEQLGVPYQDIVNQVRAQWPDDIELRVGRVRRIAPGPELTELTMNDGSTLRARLAVLSTGMAGDLYEQLGIQRRMVHAELSMVFGFMLARKDGQSFGFDAVTYRPSTIEQRVGYITLFRFGDLIRANLFTYWPARDERSLSMVRAPALTLRDVLPGMEAVIGDYAVDGKVEPFRIDLYRMESCALPGVVLVGDAYQSVCPSTGMGLSKVLTDVDVLCNDLAPQWFSSPGMGVEKTSALYRNPRKQEVDDRALKAAIMGRRQIIDRSPVWQLRRAIRDWRWATGR